MTDTTSTTSSSDEIPFPLLERGDIVRLKEPYQLAPSRHLATAVEATASALATVQIEPGDLPDYLDTADVLHSSQDENLARHAFHQIGVYDGPTTFLYNEHSSGIRHRKQLDRLPEESEDLWIVTADVHF